MVGGSAAGPARVEGGARGAGGEAERGALEGVVESGMELLPKAAARGLRIGTPDPHELLEPGEVRELQKGRGKGTFSIDRLDPADASELRLRPLMDMNPVPRTVARQAPPSQKGGAPVVTAIDQVVPRETLKVVGSWRTRLKACLRAASRGNLQLARRLRPGDLELEASVHTVEGAQGWVWDLRPLVDGGCAVPLASSSYGAPPRTDLDLDSVKKLSEGFRDQEIISEMIQGFSDDSVGTERHVVLSPPHLGALKYASQAQEKMRKDVERGWSQVVSEIPFWPLRSNPYSIVREEREDKVKYRMTIDLSWPRPGGDGEAVSVNDSMDRSVWVQVKMLRVTQLAEAAAILKTSGLPVRLWSFDCEAYYRKTGRQRGEVWRNCVAVEGGFVVDEREQFGDASAAVKCCRQSAFLAWLVGKAMRAVDEEFPVRDATASEWLRARRTAAEAGERLEEQTRSEVGSCGIYVDDGSGASVDDVLVDRKGRVARKAGPDERGREGAHRAAAMRRAEAHFLAATRAVAATGHVSEVSKEVAPREKIVTLGMELDVRGEGRMRLSEWKRKRYAQRVDAVLGQGEACDREPFEAMMHRLLFASCAMPVGRQYLNPLFRVAKAKFRLSGGRVRITTRVRQALGWWATNLRGEHEGVPLACRKGFPPVGDERLVVTYSDASGGFGFGGWAEWKGRILYVSGEWSDEERAALHINVKELFAMSATLAAVMAATGATYVMEFTDNTAAEGAARRTAPSAVQLQQLVQRRVALLRSRGAYSRVERVGTHENLWADLISRRNGEAVFRRQVEEMGMEAVRLAVPDDWRDTTGLVWHADDPELG